jgi:hypothetical protein
MNLFKIVCTFWLFQLSALPLVAGAGAPIAGFSAGLKAGSTALESKAVSETATDRTFEAAQKIYNLVKADETLAHWVGEVNCNDRARIACDIVKRAGHNCLIAHIENVARRTQEDNLWNPGFDYSDGETFLFHETAVAEFDSSGSKKRFAIDVTNFDGPVDLDVWEKSFMTTQRLGISTVAEWDENRRSFDGLADAKARITTRMQEESSRRKRSYDLFVDAVKERASARQKKAIFQALLTLDARYFGRLDSPSIVGPHHFVGKHFGKGLIEDALGFFTSLTPAQPLAPDLFLGLKHERASIRLLCAVFVTALFADPKHELNIAAFHALLDAVTNIEHPHRPFNGNYAMLGDQKLYARTVAHSLFQLTLRNNKLITSKMGAVRAAYNKVSKTYRLSDNDRIDDKFLILSWLSH